MALDPRARNAALRPFFFLSGGAMGTWSASIPLVREQVGVSTAVMSGLVLMLGLATVSSGLLAGQFLTRFPSASMARIGGATTTIGAALAIAAPSPAALVGALILFGGTYALLDVSMNAHGFEIETRHGVTILSSLHASWSIGGLVGAGAVALAGALGMDHRLEAAIFCALMVLIGAAAGPGLSRLAAAAGPPLGASRRKRERLVLPVGGVVVIGLLAILLYTGEGVVLDWGGLYVVQDAAGSAALGAAAVAGFSAGMAVGRLVGDAAHRRWGRAALLQLGTGLVAAALIVQALAGVAWLAIPTLFLAGVGVANSAPLLLGAAAACGDMPPGAAIAATTMMGDLGLLFVAPLLGTAAQPTSFAVTFAVAGVLSAVGVVLIRRGLPGRGGVA